MDERFVVDKGVHHLGEIGRDARRGAFKKVLSRPIEIRLIVEVDGIAGVEPRHNIAR